MKLIPHVNGLPAPRGPFSQGVAAEGKFLFISGQGPWDMEKNEFVCGTIAEQTELTLRCIERVAREAGASLSDVVSCRVFLQPLNPETFAEMNAVHARIFGDHKPARTTVGCTLLGIDVEIDAVIQLPS